MPAFKRQHYLPAVYLKHFSIEKVHLTRKSKVWRCDGKGSLLVSTESQCAEDYFYSKTQASAIEGMFGEAEGLYAKFLPEILAGRTISGIGQGTILVFMFDLHVRNAAYENLTGMEGFQAYQGRSLGLRSLLLNRHVHDPVPTDDEISIYLQKYCKR